MLLPTNQFHGSFKCLYVISHKDSIYRAAFVIFLYEGVYLQTRLVQESFLQEELAMKMGHKKPSKKIP